LVFKAGNMEPIEQLEGGAAVDMETPEDFEMDSGLLLPDSAAPDHHSRAVRHSLFASATLLLVGGALLLLASYGPERSSSGSSAASSSDGRAAAGGVGVEAHGYGVPGYGAPVSLGLVEGGGLSPGSATVDERGLAGQVAWVSRKVHFRWLKFNGGGQQVDDEGDTIEGPQWSSMVKTVHDCSAVCEDVSECFSFSLCPTGCYLKSAKLSGYEKSHPSTFCLTYYTPEAENKAARSRLRLAKNAANEDWKYGLKTKQPVHA
jgi:hypothetical protein